MDKTNTLPQPHPQPQPRPWSISARRGDQGDYWIITDAHGWPVMLCVNKPNIALIVDAVNEIDHLRDLVRRLADELQGECVEAVMALVREARAAIGEEVRQ